MKIIDFCHFHAACAPAIRYIQENIPDATCEEAIEACSQMDWIVWLIDRPNVLSDESKRELAITAATEVADLTLQPDKVLECLQILRTVPHNSLEYLQAEIQLADLRRESTKAWQEHKINSCQLDAVEAACYATRTDCVSLCLSLNAISDPIRRENHFKNLRRLILSHKPKFEIPQP